MKYICQECGKEYKMDLMIPNDLWKKITNTTKERLCPVCIVKRIEKLRGRSIFFLVDRWAIDLPEEISNDYDHY